MTSYLILDMNKYFIRTLLKRRNCHVAGWRKSMWNWLYGSHFCSIVLDGIFGTLCYCSLFIVFSLLQLSMGECNIDYRCMVLQCCKIKWNEENLGPCFQVKLNCNKVDKIICKAFLSCKIEIMQLFYHLEVGQLF